MLHNEISRGPNDPACFTLSFFGYGNKDTFRADVVCSAFRQMEEQYKEIQEERERFARETSLQAKIESSEVRIIKVLFCYPDLVVSNAFVEYRCICEPSKSNLK